VRAPNCVFTLEGLPSDYKTWEGFLTVSDLGGLLSGLKRLEGSLVIKFTFKETLSIFSSGWD